MKYDILFCVATYKSTDSAIRFANSIANIDGNHLCVITGSIEDDGLQRIAKNTDAVVFASEINSLYLSRAWGFVWAALKAGLRSKYMCSCDDDIEFGENSKDILAQLDKAAGYGFSILSFNGSAHRYTNPARADTVTKDYVINFPWVNGDCMFSQWDDNLRYGLPDTLLDTPISFYTEIEYQHRMKALTGKPLLVPTRKDVYTHHFRKDHVVAAMREQLFAAGHVAGLGLWKKKYGHTIDNLSGDVWRRVENAIDYAAFPARHIMFGEDEINWTAAYNNLKDKFEVIHG